MRRTRQAGHAERLTHAPAWSPEDQGEHPFDETFDITPAAVSARTHEDWAPGVQIAAARNKPPPPGTDPRLIPPVSVTAARKLPDYAKPHGWKASIKKEVTRVEGFGAWELVPHREYRMMVGQVLRGIEWHYGRQLVGSHDVLTIVLGRIEGGGRRTMGGRQRIYSVADQVLQRFVRVCSNRSEASPFIASSQVRTTEMMRENRMPNT